MLRVQLDEQARSTLHQMKTDQELSGRVSTRIQMLLLSDAGWSPPRIADYLGVCAHTVRRMVRDYQERGLPALRPRSPGPLPNLMRRQQIEDVLWGLWSSGQATTAPQLSQSLVQHDIQLSARQVRKYLKRMGLSRKG